MLCYLLLVTEGSFIKSKRQIQSSTAGNFMNAEESLQGNTAGDHHDGANTGDSYQSLTD